MRTLRIKSEVTFTVHEIAILKDGMDRTAHSQGRLDSSSYRQHTLNASVRVQRLDTEEGYNSLSVWSGYNAKAGAESNVRLILQWGGDEGSASEQRSVEFNLNKICHATVDREGDLKPIMVTYLLREVEIEIMLQDHRDPNQHSYFTARIYFEYDEEMQEFLQLIELYAFIDRATVQSMALMDVDDPRGHSSGTRSQL